MVWRALLKPRLGMRRIKGIWPPSKPMRMELPERAVCPLPPRPLVLPWPLDSPCPSRLRRCLAPGRGFKSCKRILNCDNWGCRRRWRCRFYFARLYFDAAAAHDVRAQSELLQSSHRRLDDVGWIIRTERLAQNILHAGGFENGSNGFPGDNACSRRGGAQ